MPDVENWTDGTWNFLIDTAIIAAAALSCVALIWIGALFGFVGLSVTVASLAVLYLAFVAWAVRIDELRHREATKRRQHEQ